MPHLNWLFGIEQSLSCAVLLLILLEILLIQYLRYFVDYQWWHGGLYKHCLDLYSTEATSLIVDEANKPKCACLFTDYSRCLSVFFFYLFIFCETWWLQTLIKAFLVTSLDHKTVVLDKTAKQKCFCHLLHCRGNIPVTSASLSLFCTITASSKGSADAMTVKYATIPDHTCWDDFLIHHTCRYLHFCGIYSMKYASIWGSQSRLADQHSHP